MLRINKCKGEEVELGWEENWIVMLVNLVRRFGGSFGVLEIFLLGLNGLIFIIFSLFISSGGGRCL